MTLAPGPGRWRAEPRLRSTVSWRAGTRARRGVAPPCANPFKSLLVRLVEVAHAFEEAIRVIDMGVQRRDGHGHRLSPVAASVNRAADIVLALVESLAGFEGESGLVT